MSGCISENYMSLSEIAFVRGCTRTNVLQAVRRGRLPAERVGRVWMVRREDAEEYMSRPVASRGRRAGVR